MFKAIPIQYGGYQMRSKLEAKWAAFLDYLRIEYQYEPRSYALEGGIGYLPDFYLPEQDIFLEIKPDKELSEFDANKIYFFSLDANIKANLVLLRGEPDMFQHSYYYVKGFNQSPVEWAWSERDRKAFLQNKGTHTGDPNHSTIYGAIDHSRENVFFPIRT